MAGVIGEPVRHSLSPALHNAAFQAVGLDWVYLAFEVPAGSGAAAVEAMRALGIDGLNVTMPHKSDVAEAVDRLSPVAEKLGAVNTVVRRGGVLVGESTDGAGFIDALRADEGFDPAGKRCVVLGAGGAARAVVLALSEASAAEVIVVGRTPERVAAAAALGGRVGTAEEAAEADLIVNATPVGMAAGAGGEEQRLIVALAEAVLAEQPAPRPAAGALARLTDNQRRLLTMSAVERRPVREVAELEGLTPEAVKSALARARRSFRDGYAALVEQSTAPLPEVPLDPTLLGPGQLVVDLVYHPLQTPLLAVAKARGAVAVNGLGMLIHQAAHAFRLWTGEDPPLEVMSATALGALAHA